MHYLDLGLNYGTSFVNAHDRPVIRKVAALSVWFSAYRNGEQIRRCAIATVFASHRTRRLDIL